MNLPKLFLQRIENQLGKNNFPFFLSVMNEP
ncbi:MAG: hypothetical protein RLZZ388_788, partial [Bacillota bacterium]